MGGSANQVMVEGLTFNGGKFGGGGGIHFSKMQLQLEEGKRLGFRGGARGGGIWETWCAWRLKWQWCCN